MVQAFSVDCYLNNVEHSSPLSPLKGSALPLTQYVVGVGDEKAGAACLAPHPLVGRPGRGVVVIARKELALVDPQLAVEKVQFLDTRMSMCWVARSGCEAHKHGNPVCVRVARKQLALNPRRDLFPFRLAPLPRRQQRGLLGGLFGNATRKASSQRYRGAQDVGRPGNEAIDDAVHGCQLAQALRA